MRKIFSIYLIAFLFLSSMIILSACKGTEPTLTPTPTTDSLTSSTDTKSSIVSEGEVVPIKFASLSFSIAGVLEEVVIKEGDMVKEGEVIARLEGKERLEAAVTAAELELLSAQQALDDLHDNIEVTKANAELALAQAETAYDDAKDRREKMDLSWRNKDQIDNAYANYVIAEQRVKDAEKDFDDNAAWRQDSDPIRANFLSRLASARNTRDQTLSQWQYMLQGPDQFEISEADKQIDVTKAALDKAKLDWEDLKDGLDDDAVDLAESRVKNTEAQLIAAKDDLKDLEISSPFDAMIITNDLKVGEVVSSNTPQVTVADVSTWKVETTDLTELDVPEVQVEMPVTVSFDAIPELELGGKIEKIKNLGENKQGDITYTVTIALDGNDDRLRWKMTAYVSFQP